MDIYDPQTLGAVVFGGFMVISAIGIFLVSTFSMKEMSYEEALASQRKEMEKTHPYKVDKKKKEKPVEKKGKAKKKEEKPNGKIPEQEPLPVINNFPKDLEPEPPVAVEPVPVDHFMGAAAAPPGPVATQEQLASSPKDKRKKEKKVAKVEPAPCPALGSIHVLSSKASLLEVAPKEVPVVAVPPVGTRMSTLTIGSASNKQVEVAINHADLKQEVPAKKKSVSKKKSEPAFVDGEGPLYLPFKALVSSIGSTAFNDGEAQQLLEILSEKAGIVQDTWHTASQKGDPVMILKRQLEEKEKLLATEQEDAAVVKNRLRELNKELAAEKSKAAAGEAKLKKQLLAHEQEFTAVQARMQASYQGHMKEVQQLQGKIRSLQEQLENGPNTQLARLQQENSILRDALNQATSQMESKQNAELAKLRQECGKLMKELTDKTQAMQQEEQLKKNLEIKAVAYEKQINQLQVSQKETEGTLQKRLEEVSMELRKSQTSCRNLLAEAEKARGEQKNIAELHSKLQSSEKEVKSKSEELSHLKGKLSEASSENAQLTERIKSIEALLEAGQAKAAKDEQASFQAELNQLQARLQEREAQLSTLEKEATKLKEAIEQEKTKNNDLRKKNWTAMEAVSSTEKACEEKLSSSTKAKEETEKQLRFMQTQTKELLQSLFPQVTVAAQQGYGGWLQEFKEKSCEILKQQAAESESLDLAPKLREAEEAQSTLQSECDQYRTILAETEGMLKDLQKSVEEEERIWKTKLSVSEEELQKSYTKVKRLEETVDKLKGDLQNADQVKEYTSLLEAQLESHLATASAECQNYTKEMALLKQLLVESQEELSATKTEAQKQSKELALVRQQLSEMKNHVQDGEVVGSQADPTEQEPLELKTQLEKSKALLENEQSQRQKLTAEFEEAQNSASSLQAELETLRSSRDLESSETEEAVQLKERLEKEKKLTKDLGRAATKLQELLKATQEQLTKEKEAVKKLQEQLEGTKDGGSGKEGTSV
ncbi:ribosome-binding protein 1 [Ornithorhynchus anatinus]|uniref:ribosome-binding protein 1 n=1 Tax=Ornithorhynchus anatinus TaxID=9258 RepID=UPI0010A83D99|nr:ribosome-binding protein 1 [Ornithorhynchus anatinus]